MHIKSIYPLGGIVKLIGILNCGGQYSLSNLTTLYDQEYMAGVREKLRFIKDMQAEQARESVLP